MPTFVVDISRWDGDVVITDLKKAGVGAVIAKCGGGDDGLYTDSKWEQNYRNCKSIGMPIGAYWYLGATTVAKAKEEAEYCLKLLLGKSLEYPIYVDVEEKAHQQMTPTDISRVICAFTDVLESAGWLPGVYSWKWLLQSCNVNVFELEWWVCSWTRTNPCGCGMWQFGGETNLLRSTTVAGYKNMDQSYAYYDYPTIIKEAGLNGFKKETAVALSVPEKTAQVAEHFAAHDAHGYSQYNRGTGAAETIKLSDGSKVTISGADVDCSEMAKQCVNVALSGGYKKPIDYMWTGNEDEMLRANGFVRMAFVKSKVCRGDILLRSGHTAVATSATKQAEAFYDENGGLGGKSGDQTKAEVAINPLSSNWTYIYRYAKAVTAPKPVAGPFRVKIKNDCNIRSFPDALNAAVIVGQLKTGKIVKCDGILIANGSLWAHYTYRKQDRYISLASAHDWVEVLA